MDVVLLAVIGLVLLVGLVAIAIGNKGWSWGTVAAAILVLLAATGYLYLAARLAERERSWREKIAKSQAEIDRIEGTAAAAASPKSLAALRNQRDRWTRALAFVDTWHGRAWDKASLSPPRDGKPGTISIEKAREESELAPLAAGGEVAVFDNASVADEGRFLGLFRVQDVKVNKEGENCLLTIVPASTPAPPSEADTKLWTRSYDEVTVYESLPVDRWLAFHKTPAGDAAADAADSPSSDRWRPAPRKAAAGESLESLEQQMQAFAEHDQEVPEDQWAPLGEKLAGGEILPGRYWAVVEFTKDVAFTKADKFTPAEAGGAESEKGDEGPAGEIGGMIGGEDDEGGGVKAISPDPSEGAITKWFELKKLKQGSGKEGFLEGEKAEFDLQTALDLQNDKQCARITRVIERRPLADPFTAIRGSEFSAKNAAGEPIRAEGSDAIRQALLVEMAAIEQATIRVKASHDNVEAQASATAEEKKQLDGDLNAWAKDVAAAEAVAGSFDDRLRAATIELAAMEATIAQLGRDLTGAWATLTETIDARTPR